MDPRRYAAEVTDEWPSVLPQVDANPADPVAALHAIAADGIAASTWTAEEAHRTATRGAVRGLIRNGNGEALARAVEHAPSLAIARYLWRSLEAADTDPRVDASESVTTLATTLFAIPVVIVAAGDPAPQAEHHAMADVPSGVVTGDVVPQRHIIRGIHDERERVAGLLREHHAFGACETFALAGTLATAGAIGVARLPELLAATNPDVTGTDLVLEGGDERVFLRFLVGALLTAPGVDVLQANDTGAWGVALARMLQANLAPAGVTLLALPRPAHRLVSALRSGRTAQREIAAQVFASNAIRKFRASVGEPTAILSAHRTADAPGGGELRLSLSSPFDARGAEGLRVALYPYESVRDVAAMLVALLADCQVADVRIEPGVHPDFDRETGLRRLFKDSGVRITPGPMH
ncbi:MAG: hypothetical protein ACREX6_03655 [Casimicrobiaceae bacterium]